MFDRNALAPTAVLDALWLDLSACAPTAVFVLPVAFTASASVPIDVFELPEVFNAKADFPIAVFDDAVKFADRAFSPSAVFEEILPFPLPTRTPLNQESRDTPIPPATVRAPVAEELDGVVDAIEIGRFAA